MPLPLSAATFGNFTYIDNGTTISITGVVSQPSGAVTIPGTINNKPVTSIADYVFNNSKLMTSVTIPSSVKRIGTQAFSVCSGLTSVTIPSSITTIDSLAFSFCSGLTSVIIPASVTSIGTGAFSACSSLTSISVDAANPNYSSLDGVILNKLQTALIQFPAGKGGEYTIPDGITSIADYAFFSCDNLTNVIIPYYTTAPFSVTSIGQQAFSGCDGLKSVVIPPGVTSIGSGAFYSCSTLTSADFLGNAPAIIGYIGVFDRAASGFTVKYHSGATGFTSPTWKNYPSVMTAFPTGSIKVNISPVEAVSEGAAWAAVAGGAWQPSGATISGIKAGLITVYLKDLSGWISASYVVAVNANQITTLIGAYAVPTGALQVNIIPAAAVSAGAMWQVDGGTWQTSGATISGLSTKVYHLVGFTTLSGWYSPGWQVMVKADQIHVLTATYVIYPLSISTATLPNGKIGVAYSQALQATGGTAPYTWSLVSGSLPSELILGSSGVITGTPTAATTEKFTIKVTGSDSQFITANFTLTITTPFATWQETKFTAADIATGLTTMAADFENDGLVNVLEYAFGTDPKVANASPVAVNFSGNNLQLSFPCDATRTDITYTVQASSALDSWTDIAMSIGGKTTVPIGSLSTVSDSGTGLRTVTVADSNTLPAGGRRFLRVKVTAP